jgi:hypothetical protein
MKNMKQIDSNDNTYTAYLVRDTNGRRYLNRKVYSGRIRGVWGKMGDSHIFNTAAQAQSCASNINNRRPYGYSAYNAQVVEIQMQRREPVKTTSRKR